MAKEKHKSPDDQPQQAPVRRVLCQPPVDIYEEPDGLVLRADLPGVTKDSLDLVIEDNVLKIFGRASTTFDPEARGVHHEFRMGDFYRSFIFGEEVDPDNIRAELEDGVLTLRLPRRPTRPRRIELDVK